MSNKMKTPLLRPLRKNGSTLYMFPSAQEDIGLNINNSATGAALSSFALLNLTRNNFGITPDGTSRSIQNQLAKEFQNYVMNFETTVLNETDYDFQQSSTVSEKVFWHWMMEQKGFQLEEIKEGSGIFREKNCGCGNTERVVQCFGQIDAGNSLSSEFGMYNETYVTVPTSYGNGPVFFRKSDDFEDRNYTRGDYPSSQEMGGEYIQGRTGTDYSYVGDLKARYDNSSTRKYTVGDMDQIEIVKDFQTVSSALTILSNKGVSDANDMSELKVSSWDDINIDALEQLKDIENGIYDMNSHGCEFKFNAILLYYSVYDLDDEYKQPLATNLFGIVFLDGGSDGFAGTGDYQLPPISKKKSYRGQSSTNAYFGNSYSFRVNIKSLSVYDNTDAYIDDATTSNSLYSQDFNDVVDSLNRAVDMLNFNSHTINAIQDRYQTMVSVTSEMQDTINRMPSEIKAEVSQVMDASLSALDASLKQYTDDQIDDLKTRLGIFDDDTEVVVPDTNTDTTLYGSMPPLMLDMTNEMNLLINNILDTMGIIRIDSIIDETVAPDKSGRYLVRNSSGDVYGTVYTDGNNVSDVTPCEPGKIYSVGGINYQFDGTTVSIIGEKPSKKSKPSKK